MPAQLVSALAAQAGALVAAACLGGSALAQEADEPPIDPYPETEAAAPPEAEPVPPAEDDVLANPPPPANDDVETGTLPAYPVMPAAAAKAPAQPAPRSGLMGGIALGIGSLGTGNDSDGTLNYTLSFGGYLTSSLALLVDFWGGRAQDGDFRIDNSKQGVSALYWLHPSMWGKASVASASYTTYIDDLMLAEFRGIAVGAGAGWDFYSRGSFHFDARASITIEAYQNARDKVTSAALQLGVHYF